MKKELQTIESANTATAVLSPLSQTGDKNTQVAHADHVVILFQKINIGNLNKV